MPRMLARKSLTRNSFIELATGRSIHILINTTVLLLMLLQLKRRAREKGQMEDDVGPISV